MPSVADTFRPGHDPARGRTGLRIHQRKEFDRIVNPSAMVGR
jgi:hypothetical protein